MDNSGAFRPLGPTTLITAATSAPAAVQLGGPNSGEVSIFALNDNTVTIFLAYGSTAAQAAANAVIPTVGTPSNGVIALHPSVPYCLNMPAGLYYTAIIGTGTGPLYLTPGNGKL